MIRDGQLAVVAEHSTDGCRILQSGRVRKKPDIAIGNIVGSNIFNILAILGISATVAPITAHGIKIPDYAVMIGLSVLLVPLLRSGMILRRLEGLLLLVIYGIYLAFLWPK